MNTTIKTKTDWYFRFFAHQDYLDIYSDMTGPERTERELRFCSQVLNWLPGQTVLDAPCGAGRHVYELTGRGFQVTGLDASLYLLQQANSRLPELPSCGFKPSFVRGLLQRMPLRRNTFDYAICMFSSFGYGEDETENLMVARDFFRVLKPGGKLLIDVMNRHFTIPILQKSYDSVHNGLKVHEERTITDDGKRLNNQITVTDKDGNKRIYLYRPWLFNGWELSWLAVQAGFEVDKIYGNFWGDPYKQDSERAMLVAKKPQ